MSTDIRATKQAIADNLAATQAAQTAANTAQAAANTAQSSAVAAQNTSDTNSASIQSALDTIAVNAGAMVRKFGPVAITAAEFTLNSISGFYEHLLTHSLLDEAPDVEVIDSQREKQIIQSIGVDENSVKLELTVSDVANNAWPLYAIVFGKSGSVLPVAAIASMFKRLGTTNHWYQLVNGTLDHSIDGNTIETPMVFLNVVEGFMLTNSGMVWVKLNDGTYFNFDGQNPTLPTTETTEVMYDSRIDFTDRIAL